VELGVARDALVQLLLASSSRSFGLDLTKKNSRLFFLPAKEYT